MANTAKSRSGNTSSKSSRTSSTKKPARSNATRSSSSRSSSKKAPAPVQTESEADSLFRKFASSKAAMPLIFIGSVILIVGIDLLVSWNKYEMFFKILGVEILIAVVAWAILTLVFSGRKNKDTDSGPAEDEV